MGNELHITTDFESFTPQTSVSFAIDFLNKNHFSHFAVTNTTMFMGMVAKEKLLAIEDKQQKMEDIAYLFQHFYIESPLNILDYLSLFATNRTNVIPVINHQTYVGYITLHHILHQNNDLPILTEKGFTLVVEKEAFEYSFSEVSQIVENNSGKIMGCFLLEVSDAQAKLLVKFKAPNVNEIIQTFRRYDYQIVSKHSEDYHLEYLEENSEYLEKYLNI